MSDLYADLAIPAASSRIFSYLVPNEMRPLLRCGMRVVAPLGKRTVVGIVAGLGDAPGVYAGIPDQERSEPLSRVRFKHIRDVLDREPVLTDDLLRLSRWMAEYYCAPLGEVLNTVSVALAAPRPAAALLRPRTESTIPVDKWWRDRWSRWLASGGTKRNGRQRAVVSELLSTPFAEVSVPATTILRKAGASSSTLNTLARQGLLTLESRETVRTDGYDLYAAALGARDISLNRRQEDAIRSISSASEAGEFKTFLLFGVTGSGKTEVYIEAIRGVLLRKKTAIVLVPEIALTQQIVRRFKHRFGEQVAVQHSRMNARERHDVWKAAREGAVSIVIGPRSAVFAPLKNLGLIVVDEEQESSYKQYDQSPHYHARDVAIVRGSIAKAIVVLGSATPSLESFNNASRGKFELLELPERVDDATLPAIEIVDMADERKARYAEHRALRKADFKTDPVRARAVPRKFQMTSLSAVLKEKIADRLKKKEGIIILQNRRGYSPFIECYDCGHVEMCPNCSISLTYHSPGRDLRCHYCGLVKPAPASCPNCSSPDIEFRGFGTQRVEDELKALFPGVSMVRMDRDTTARKNSHDQILRKFFEGEADILLGTQMVAKGLDVSRVTLVGVISADTQMLLPDFRSSEHTYQLLAQVAGRAGRSKLPGEVVIQTYLPRHETLAQVVTHDFRAFYEREAGYRKRLAYPPYSRLVLIEFKGEEEPEVLRRAAAFAASLRGNGGGIVALGPATAAIARIRGLFRCHVLLKDLKRSDTSGREFRAALERALRDYRKSARGEGSGVKITIDVDPVGMM